MKFSLDAVDREVARLWEEEARQSPAARDARVRCHIYTKSAEANSELAWLIAGAT